MVRDRVRVLATHLCRCHWVNVKYVRESWSADSATVSRPRVISLTRKPTWGPGPDAVTRVARQEMAKKKRRLGLGQDALGSCCPSHPDRDGSRLTMTSYVSVHLAVDVTHPTATRPTPPSHDCAHQSLSTTGRRTVGVGRSPSNRPDRVRWIDDA